MVRTLVELVIAPLLAAAATLAARRWGPRAGGVVSAFPAIVGPVLLIDALEHGASFAAHAAATTVLGLVALSAFALGYSRSAGRRGWRASLAAGWVCAALASLTAGLVAGGWGAPAGLLTATISLLLAHRALPSSPRTPPARLAGRYEIPTRMATTALLVSALAAAAGALGALVGGMLAALPILASVLSVFTHGEQDGAAAVALLRGTLAGMAGFVVFCELVALLIVPYGVAPAFVAATLTAVAAQALAIRVPGVLAPAR